MHGRILLFLLALRACLVTCAASDTATSCISGRVVDGGTGAPMAYLSVVAASAALGHRHLGDWTVTDSNGAFCLPVPPGEVALQWSGAGSQYDEVSDPMPTFSIPASGLCGVVLKVPRCQVVVGCVRDHLGQRIKGASATVGALGRNPGATTDENGRFTLTLPPRQQCDPG
jgi:hypothetical protein